MRIPLFKRIKSLIPLNVLFFLLLSVRSIDCFAIQGVPFSTYFSPADYSAGLQNWAFVEDNRGILYVGNAGGVLEFDGQHWKLITLPNHRSVRSLACDTNGRVWVGGSGEIGYLSADSLGRTIYVSLLQSVPEPYQDFHRVWNIFIANEGIYFKTDFAIFRWSGEEMSVWPADPKWHMAHFINDQFYVRKKGVGLFRMEKSSNEETLQIIPDGERMANLYTYVMLPFDDDQLLVGTREEGFFLYDGNKFEKFDTKVDDRLIKARIFSPPGLALPNGQFGIGTLADGIFIINQKGELVHHLNTENGLTDNTILSSYVDRKGNIWLGHDKGITRMAYGSPYSHYATDKGIKSWVTAITTYGGKLFIGDFDGLYAFDPAADQFQQLDPSVTEVFSLLSTPDYLLAGSAKLGIYEIKEGGPKILTSTANNDYQVLSLHHWNRDPNYVFAGLRDGLAVLQRQEEDWIDNSRLPELNFDVSSIAEDENGNLWLGTGNGRIIRIGFPELLNDSPVTTQKVEQTAFGKENGLIDGLLTPFYIDGQIYVTGLNETVFTLDEESQNFIHTPLFDEAKTGHPLGSFKLREDDDGNVWITSTYGTPYMARPQGNNSYSYDVMHYMGDKQIMDSYPSSDGTVWFSGIQELIRYEPQFDHDKTIKTGSLIRKVAYNGDLLLYGGMGPSGEIKIEQSHEAITFSYLKPGELVQPRFRTRIVGFDEQWSSWSKELKQSYTNLPPGDYSFQVEAEENGTTSINFTVLPKWYQTWWAKLIYALLLVLILEIARRAVKRRVQLQEKKKFELIQARNSLSEKEILLKEIHHRVKNNLQLVSGILELQASKVDNKALRDNLFECQKRLGSMALIHEQLYKGENLSEISFKEYIHQLTNDIATAFGSPKRRIEIDIDVIDIRFDVNTGVPLGLIVTELITNTYRHAFGNRKKGKVKLRLHHLDDDDYQMIIQDDGVGIPEGFDFKSSKSLGIRLVNGLVRQLDGDWDIQNGVGTTVTINFKDNHQHE